MNFTPTNLEQISNTLPIQDLGLNYLEMWNISTDILEKKICKIIMFKSGLIQSLPTVMIQIDYLTNFFWDTYIIYQYLQFANRLTQDQAPHEWDLILASACLPPALLFSKDIAKS